MPEMVDDKQVQTSSPAAASAPRKDVFLLAAKGWVVLTALCWGATVALLVSVRGWLGAGSLQVGTARLSPAGLVAGAVVAAAILFLVLRKFGGRLAYLKPGLAKGVRLSTYLGVVAMTLFGVYSFYLIPEINSPWWRDMFQAIPIFGKSLSLKPILFPTVAIFATVVLAAHLLLNQERWTEFLVETEGEMKKVSWPARKEYLGSSMVVVLVIAVVSVFLHFVDIGLSEIMRKLGIGF